MKKFTLSILAVVMTAFVMTSCIDNAVSPEVKAIRAAQVNLLNAQTALKNAEAAVQTAEAALRNANAAMQQANAAYRNSETELNLVQVERDLVTLQKEQAAAEYYVAQQEYLLQLELDKLAEYLADHPVEEANYYLGKYSTASAAVRTLSSTIATQVKLIADLNLYYITGSSAYLDNVRVFKQRALDEAELALANAEAALEIILAVEADPAAAEAEKAEVVAQIQDLTNQILAQKIITAPLTTVKTDANTALTPAANKKTKEDNLVSAINAVKAAVAANVTKVTTAETAVTTALNNANSFYAKEMAQLAPFEATLVSTYASQGVFGDSIINILQAARVAFNALRVARAQEIASVGSAGANLGKANTSVNNVIARVRTITGKNTTQIPWDPTDDKKTPNYPITPAVQGDYDFTSTAAVTITAGATYTSGGVTYTFNDNIAASTTITSVVGKGVLAAGAVLTKATGTGDNTVTINGTAPTVVVTYVANSENGALDQNEITAMYDQLVGSSVTGTSAGGGSDLDPAGALTTTTLSSNYKNASSIFNAIGAFYTAGTAYNLVALIDKYDEVSFLADFQTAKGVIANMTLDGGNGGVPAGATDGVWLTYKNAVTNVATVKAYYTSGIKTGNRTGDGVTGDSGTLTGLDANLTPITAPTTDGDKLGVAYAQIAGYSTSDTYTAGGETDALAMETAALASQTAATAAYTPLKAAYDAAKAAEDASLKIETDLGKIKTDLGSVKTAIENFLTQGNLDVTTFKNTVEAKQKLVDAAEYALLRLDDDEIEIDAKIAYEEERLADMQTELAGRQAEAAAWLALLNAALGN